MNLDVHWHLPGRIIYSYDVLSVSERIERNREILRLLETEGQPPKVHLLIDFSSTGHGNYILGLQDMIDRQETNEELKQLTKQVAEHPLLGWVVSIGEQNQSLTAAATVLATKLKYRRRAVDTLEEALDFLKKADASLPLEPKRREDS